MNDFINLNRLSTKCIDLLSAVSKVHDIAKVISLSPTQENIDKLTAIVTEFQTVSNEIPECLVSLLKEVVENDVTETDATETEFGYKL